MLSPDGIPMCRCSKKRALWYVNRGLAEQQAEDPLTIQLKFIPNGLGKAGDVYYLAKKTNHCVVCGSEVKITRHHIVPKCFRRHFPSNLKNHNSYDILPLCWPCHCKYEKHAYNLKKKISEEYQVPIVGNKVVDQKLLNIKKYGSALWFHKDKIPEPKKYYLIEVLKTHFEVANITDEHIEYAQKLDPFMCSGRDWKSFGQLVVSELTDFQNFVYRWRVHFLKCMKPKFLSPHWQPEKAIYEDI
jgi:hypothetical protein